MADWRLDQKTEETPQSTDLSMLVRGTSVFKTTFQKIKEFVIGTTSMGTTATDVTGAVKEINDKVGIIDVENDGDIASQLNDLTNNKQDKLEDSGWLDLPLQNGTALAGNSPKYRKIDNRVFLRGCANNLTLNSVIGVLPAGFRPAIGAHIFLAPYTSNSSNFAKLGISTNGEINFSGTNSDITNDSTISLVGISFIVN